MPKIIALKRQILNEKVNFPLCMAPMVGLSHVGLRWLARRYLPAGALTIWPTEMLNSRKLPHQKLGSTPETFRDGEERFLVPQILGNDENEIRQSMQVLQEWGISGVDINMGCPVKKALRHNYGVALMGDASYASKVVAMTVKASRVPVSVKLRAGEQGDVGFLVDFCQGLEQAGASWLTLHPRTAEQKRRGKADWSQIRALRNQTKLPVIGNGDIQTSDDVQRMLEETECDMVMVGRALTARPWLFWQLGELWGWPPPEGREGEEAPKTPLQEGIEFGRCQIDFLQELEKYYEASLGLRKFKFFVTNCHQWLDFGHAYYTCIQKAKTYEEMVTVVKAFFSKPHHLSEKTSLRY